MKYIVGIDLGTRMTKCVLMDAEKDKVLAKSKILSGHDLQGNASKILQQTCEKAEIEPNEVEYIAATGYGRYLVSERNIQITDISCHSKGAQFLFPETRFVLDVGAQYCRAMQIEPNGRVTKFRMNDKCASGAGRFIERVAKGLELDLEQVGELSLRSKDPQMISSICAVLAESEVINLVTNGSPVEDILMGTHLSIADRMVAMLQQVGVEPPVTLTGGVTKNLGMVKALSEKLGQDVNFSEDSEYAGAIGACLLSLMRLRRISNSN